MPHGHLVHLPLAPTAVKPAMNELTVKLIESNLQIESLPAHGGVPASDGGVAAALLEALFGYDEIPLLAKAGDLRTGDATGKILRHMR